MASVTGNGSKNHHSFTLEVVENSYDINNNSSEVGFTFKIAPRTAGYNWSGWGNKISYKVNIDGTEYTGTIPSYNGSSTVTLKSGTQVVGHNNDGSKTINFSFSVTDTTGQSYTCGNASGSSTFTLTTIPRTTTNWSINGNTIGSNVTVTLVPNSSSFTHRVICYFGNDNQELSVASNQQSASATLKMAFCNQVPNATSGSGTMVVETYNGGQFIGSDSKPITLYVPNNVVPSISSVTKSDTANLVGTYGAYVQGKSNLRVVTSASGSYSSWISNITINIKDSNYNLLRQLSGDDVTLSNISYVGTLNIEVIVTDSRNRQASNTSQISVVEYFNPRINSFNAERIDNDSTVTITFSANICNINNNNVNAKEFRLYKRRKETSSWGDPILTYNSTYSYSRNDFTTTCDENYGWEFLLQAQDSFTTTSNDNPEVGTAFELINWKDDGTAMAIGKVSEHSNTLEVALKTELNGNVDVGGNLFVDGNEFNLWNGLAVYKSNNLLYSNGDISVANATIRGDIYNNSLDMFNDTSGSDWQEMLRNKIDYCINNVNTNKWNGVYYINGGWAGVRYGFGIFSKIGDWRQLVWFSNMGMYYVSKDGNNNYGYDRVGKGIVAEIHPSNNLDDFKTDGKYTYDNGPGALLNSPTSDGIHILVVTSNGGTDWLVQEDYVLRWASGYYVEKYIRYYSPAGWNNWKLISGISKSYQYTLNKTEGNGNVTYGWCVEEGYMVQIEVHFNTSGGSTAVGGNVWKGTISGLPLPRLLTTGSAFYSSTGYIGALETNGTLTIRVIGATSGQNNGDHVLCMSYIRQ